MKIKNRYLPALFNQILIEQSINLYGLKSILYFNQFYYNYEFNIIEVYNNSIYSGIINLLPVTKLKKLYFNFKKLIVKNQDNRILNIFSPTWNQNNYNVLWIRSELYCLKEKNGKVFKIKTK